MPRLDTTELVNPGFLKHQTSANQGWKKWSRLCKSLGMPRGVYRKIGIKKVGNYFLYVKSLAWKSQAWELFGGEDAFLWEWIVCLNRWLTINYHVSHIVKLIPGDWVFSAEKIKPSKLNLREKISQTTSFSTCSALKTAKKGRFQNPSPALAFF